LHCGNAIAPVLTPDHETRDRRRPDVIEIRAGLRVDRPGSDTEAGVQGLAVEIAGRA